MILKTLTISSLLCLLFSVGLWGVSYFGLIYVHPSCEFRIRQGGVEATPVSVLERTSDGWWKLTFKSGSETLRLGEDDKRWKFIGYFGMNTRWLPYYFSSTRRVFIPLWLPTLIFSGLLFWSLFPGLRKTLTILSLTGLLISAGALYVSRNPILRIHQVGGRPVIFVLSKGGALVMMGERWSQRPARCAHGGPMDRLSVLLSENRRWPHFESYSRTTTLTFPLWSLGVLFALLLLPCFYTIPLYRRRKRRKFGLCLKCGYDLRASKERCPECGRAVENSGV